MAIEIFIVLFVGISLLFFTFFIGKLIGKLLANREWEKRIPELRGDAVKRSRASLSGQFSEQLAPYLPNFPYKATEARFIGKPIDFLVFKGMDEKDISEVIFVEVKSGKSTLSTQERRLRDAIKSKKVSWEQYNIPEKMTKENP